MTRLALRSSKCKSMRGAPTELVRAVCGIYHTSSGIRIVFLRGAPNVIGHNPLPGIFEALSARQCVRIPGDADGLSLIKAHANRKRQTTSPNRRLSRTDRRRIGSERIILSTHFTLADRNKSGRIEAEEFADYPKRSCQCELSRKTSAARYPVKLSLSPLSPTLQ